VQEISQLFKIFQVLGTPNEDMWPGVMSLPDYLPSFPKWHPQDMNEILKHRLEPEGMDLLHRMLRYAPSERITPADALKHAYFKDLHSYSPGTRLPISET
jgi:serine/threonine protein kinase